MKTNFQEWYIFYTPIMLPYYYRFCYLFPPGQEPSFTVFMTHCFRNTKQTYDSSKKIFKAPIYYSA